MQLGSILNQYNLNNYTSTAMDGYESSNFKISTAGKNYVLKLYKDDYVTQQQMASENEVLLQLNNTMFPLPIKNKDGEYLSKATINGKPKLGRLLTYLEGNFLAETHHTKKLIKHFGESMARLDKTLSKQQHMAIQAKKDVWDLQYNHLSKKHLPHITSHNIRRITHHFFLQYQTQVSPFVDELRTQIIHGDANDWNVLVSQEHPKHKKYPQISGIIDFGDMCYSPLINEVAIALVYVMFDKEEPLRWANYFLSGYHTILPLQEKELDILYYLVGARLSVSLSQSAFHKKADPEKAYISISEQQAIHLIQQWLRINPVKAKTTFKKALGYNTQLNDTSNTDLKRRHQHTSKAMSLTFEKPIKMVGSAFQYMYDDLGNTYLDMYNNIPQVGHGHPKVVEAAQQQIAKLNTNSRYLNELYLQYTEALLKKFPAPINKVFLVNSGSAASDLAIRLAYAHSANQQLLVMQHGYHGNSQLGIDISHYKFGGKGGAGKKDHIKIAELPDTYRGRYTENQKEAGKLYAQDFIAQLKKGNWAIAAFITETIVGCGGQVPLADGYLPEMFKFISAQGGLCICDEVQTGFGRTGNNFWAFEKQAVIPDIVIIGKPMGNGHPIGAVVTTDAVAKSFETGMEFFSSFGGNPVSCAIGLSVLQVIENEQLQAHAQTLGNYFKTQLETLKNRFETIGDVRGEGLFLGIDLVENKTNKVPNTALAKQVKNALKESGILVGTDGPFDNVIKIKPPLGITQNNIDEFVELFGQVLDANSE